MEKTVSTSQQNQPIAKVILGKSMPRSGHHFLVGLLENILGNDFSYCPFYTQKDCCNSQPCTNSYPGMMFLQKSHDLKLTDEIPESCKFLIQYRHPVPRLFSDWDLYVWRTSRPDNLRGFLAFAEIRREYYISFFRKWILPFFEHDNFFSMSYEALVGETVKSIQSFIRFAIEDSNYLVNRSLLTASMSRIKYQKNFTSHKHYSLDFLEEYQESIFSELPELPYLPFKL